MVTLAKWLINTVGKRMMSLLSFSCKSEMILIGHVLEASVGTPVEQTLMHYLLI